MDVNNGVVKFTRRIDSISVDCVLQEGEREGPYDICRVKITAKAFLWHQVLLVPGGSNVSRSIIGEVPLGYSSVGRRRKRK